MKIRAALVLMMTACVFAAPYRLALPGYHYEFPKDHFNHPEYQTEWWYYTGNLRAADGKRFGFELTFFRHGVDRESRPKNIWDVSDVWLAHAALSDIDGGRFYHAERLNRAGAGLAGADEEKARVWNGNWQARWDASGQRLQALSEKFRIDLIVHSEKAPVIHGANGVSQKSEGEGRASHYVSLTRLLAKGTIEVNGKTYAVDGLAWMDHEFFTHQLETNQSGWDWFSLQFDDGTELMLFRLRRKDGSADPYSAGTYIDARGNTRHLSVGDFSLTPGKTWTSGETGGRYPIAWTVRVPALELDAALTTRLEQQELTGKTMAYWEGAIEVTAVKEGHAVTAVGYLEMTGYSGPVMMGD
ncbi:MAG: lipocalin-like domain-containing protein [Bryobacteraceae bacterium]